MKTAVVTGATSGIGFAVAQSLILEGWRVVLVGRSQENCVAAEAMLAEQCPSGMIKSFAADMSLMGETARLANEINDF